MTVFPSTTAATMNSLTATNNNNDKKKIAVFVVSHHSGHINPMTSLIPLYEKAGYQIHFFCSSDRKEKIQKMSPNVIFHVQAPSYQGIQDAAETTIQQRFGLPLTEMVKGSFFPDLILPSTVAMLDDGFIERVQILNPAVMVCDVSALWGILTARMLRIPLITSCSCTLFEDAGVEGAFGYIRDLPVSQKCVDWIDQQFGIQYDAAYSYMNESDFTISWSLPSLQPPSRQNNQQVHFFGAALSKSIHQDIEEEMVLADNSIVVSFIESAKKQQDKIVYCSLGTVVGQEKWSIGNRTDGNDMVTDFYKTVMETLGNRKGIQVILNIGQERRVEDLPAVPTNFMVTHYVPQRMVLSMVDTFITHCGNNGIHEAFFFGCPMLSVPVFGDQHPNASTIESIGVGVQIPSPFAPAPSLNLKHVTKELLDSKLNEILFEESRSNVVQANCNALKNQMQSQHSHYHQNGMKEMEDFIAGQQQQQQQQPLKPPVQCQGNISDIREAKEVMDGGATFAPLKDTRIREEEGVDATESTTMSADDDTEPIPQSV